MIQDDEALSVFTHSGPKAVARERQLSNEYAGHKRQPSSSYITVSNDHSPLALMLDEDET